MSKNKDYIKDTYVRVGVNYFKRITRRDSRGFAYEILEKWGKDTITDDYASRDNPKPHREVPRFDQFCNVPDNTDTYQKIHYKAFNIYQKPGHEVRKGSIDKTMAFLSHVYGKSLDFGLDYISILWRFPKERLPIHCLVSKEQKTGKSTFIEWLRMIFQSNCAIIQNQDIEGQFNSHYATKLIVAIEEANLREDRRKISEKIKFITTSTSTFINFKGIDKKEVDYYGKLFINSNEEKDFIYIEGEDTRYFVRKIPKIKVEDPDILDGLSQEIPAFLYFIQEREIIHPKKSRLWFAPEVYHTQAKMEVMKHTKPKWQRFLDEFIRECFMAFREDVLEFSPKDIQDQVRKDCLHIDRMKIIDYFKAMGLLPSPKIKRYVCYNLEKFQEMGDELDIGLHKPLKTGRPYQFKRADFLEDESQDSAMGSRPKDELPI